MTVCVAAICEGNTVLGASDRMLTAGDVQFEPQQSKLWPLTSSIVAMVAGDSAFQTEILQDVATEIRKRIESNPNDWLAVKDITYLYIGCYNQARLRRAETAILAPLGLDNASFIRRQQEMAPELVTQLATELINFESPGVSCISAGVDPTGAHLYITVNADVHCYDNVGFASVGVGGWHAQSHFMFAKHTRRKPFPESLLRTFSAKKRAEVAPGVGVGTDMFFILGLGTYTPIADSVIKDLEKIYEDKRKRDAKAERLADESAGKYVKKISEAATPKDQAEISEDGGGGKATDKEESREDTEKG